MLNIHSLQTSFPSLLRLNYSEGSVTALPLQSTGWWLAVQRREKTDTLGQDGQLANYIQVGCCPLGEQP